MATWQEMAHAAFTRAENVGTFLVKAVAALKDSKQLEALAAAEPKLVPFIDDLTSLIPGIGTTKVVINVADFAVQHWAAIQYIGAVAHFAPADALNYVPFKEDTGDTSFTSRD